MRHRKKRVKWNEKKEDKKKHYQTWTNKKRMEGKE